MLVNASQRSDARRLASKTDATHRSRSSGSSGRPTSGSSLNARLPARRFEEVLDQPSVTQLRGLTLSKSVDKESEPDAGERHDDTDSKVSDHGG
jgi:hypothetical protein